MPLTDTEFNQLQIWIGIVDFQRINNLVMHRANPMDMTSSCPRPVKTRQHNSEIGTWEVLVPVGRTIVEIRLDRKRRKEKKKENAERQKHSHLSHLPNWIDKPLRLFRCRDIPAL